MTMITIKFHSTRRGPLLVRTTVDYWQHIWKGRSHTRAKFASKSIFNTNYCDVVEPAFNAAPIIQLFRIFCISRAVYAHTKSWAHFTKGHRIACIPRSKYRRHNQHNILFTTQRSLLSNPPVNRNNHAIWREHPLVKDNVRCTIYTE